MYTPSQPKCVEDLSSTANLLPFSSAIKPVRFSSRTLKCLYSQWVVLAQSAGSVSKVADRIIVGAATALVLTAGSRFEWAASPFKAVFSIHEGAATCLARGTDIEAVTIVRGLHWRWG